MNLKKNTQNMLEITYILLHIAQQWILFQNIIPKKYFWGFTIPRMEAL